MSSHLLNRLISANSTHVTSEVPTFQAPRSYIKVQRAMWHKSQNIQRTYRCEYVDELSNASFSYRLCCILKCKSALLESD